ncbi:MAG: hypothetical protein GXP01_08050 [Alphaproteobacteria bacterium]|nr:hypothetical protein [Alphaproteobacteria bacterium]
MPELKNARRFFAVAGFLLPLALAAPVLAGPAESALLQSYVGDWKGSGLLTGGDEPEDFRCRLTIVRRNQSKIIFTGRCGLVGVNLSVRGTMAYNDAARQYEAAMTSSVGFRGDSVGRKRGNAIVFDLRKREIDDEGNDMTIGSQIILKDGQITVEFDVVFNDSDVTMTTSVPFTR